MCIFCKSHDGIEGNLLSLLADENLTSLTRANFFLIFDQIRTHCFSAGCKNCSFRITVSLDSKINLCETDMHDDIEYDDEYDDEYLDVVPIDTFDGYKLVCNFCRNSCEHEGCDEISR